jgi:pantoate--beta-alanine ligase
MYVINTIADMRRLRKAFPEPVGFVPTMGYLHEGHLTLVRKARDENSTVIVSIFVNPTQFGPNEDFYDYPRDTDRDLTILENENTDIVLRPSLTEIYPQDFNSWVEVSNVTERLEGEFRPNHFKGVATVVAKLFNIVTPDTAYFGQKDAQQLIVIKKMVRDLNMNLRVVAVPTVREPDGLAMSSRNIYLNEQERQAARVLFQALTSVQQLYLKGMKNATQLRQQMIAILNNQPMATIDYVSIADAETLDELEEVNVPALALLSVRIGNTRLIDNVVL